MQTENDVRQRISAVFAEFGDTQNGLAGGDSATQKRLNRQLAKGGAAITVETLLLILDKHTDVSAEWLLRGVGDMRVLPNGIDSPENTEIGKLEKDLKRRQTTIDTMADAIERYKARISELERLLPEQKRNVG